MPDAITQKLLDERDDIVSRANGVKKTALEHLLLASGSSNLSETMWLKSEIADAERRLG